MTFFGLQAGGFPSELLVAPERDFVADDQHTPLVPFARFLLQLWDFFRAGDFAADERSFVSFCQVNLIGPDFLAAADEESAVIAFFDGPPFELHLEIAIRFG